MGTKSKRVRSRTTRIVNDVIFRKMVEHSALIGQFLGMISIILASLILIVQVDSFAQVDIAKNCVKRLFLHHPARLQM